MNGNRNSGRAEEAGRSDSVARLLPAGLRLMQLTVAAAGVLTLAADSWWVADLLANLRLQLLMVGVVAIVVACCCGHWKVLAAQLLVFGLHAGWIAWPPARAPVVNTVPGITVTGVNAFIRNNQHETIAAVLLNLSADVIAVTELSPVVREQLTTALADSHPHVAAETDLGVFGVGLFSKFPLDQIRMTGSARTGTALLATIRKPDQEYRVAAVHSLSPMSATNFRVRNQHFRELSEMFVVEQQSGRPLIVIGDLNVTPWSPHFRTFQQSSGLRHATTGLGVQPSWHARRRTWFPLGLVLDHCLVSPQLSCASFRLGPSLNSDHLPLTVKLVAQLQR